MLAVVPFVYMGLRLVRHQPALPAMRFKFLTCPFPLVHNGTPIQQDRQRDTGVQPFGHQVHQPGILERIELHRNCSRGSNNFLSYTLKQVVRCDTIFDGRVFTREGRLEKMIHVPARKSYLFSKCVIRNVLRPILSAVCIVDRQSSGFLHFAVKDLTLNRRVPKIVWLHRPTLPVRLIQLRVPIHHSIHYRTTIIEQIDLVAGI